MQTHTSQAGHTPVSPSELRESCCAMREATEKMARAYNFEPIPCPRKEKCQALALVQQAMAT